MNTSLHSTSKNLLSLNNNNFIEQHEKNKFLANLNNDINQMNTNHISSMKRNVGAPISKKIVTKKVV